MSRKRGPPPQREGRGKHVRKGAATQRAAGAPPGYAHPFFLFFLCAGAQTQYIVEPLYSVCYFPPVCANKKKKSQKSHQIPLLFAIRKYTVRLRSSKTNPHPLSVKLTRLQRQLLVLRRHRPTPPDKKNLRTLHIPPQRHHACLFSVGRLCHGRNRNPSRALQCPLLLLLPQHPHRPALLPRSRRQAQPDRQPRKGLLRADLSRHGPRQRQPLRVHRHLLPARGVRGRLGLAPRRRRRGLALVRRRAPHPLPELGRRRAGAEARPRAGHFSRGEPAGRHPGAAVAERAVAWQLDAGRHDGRSRIQHRWLRARAPGMAAQGRVLVPIDGHRPAPVAETQHYTWSKRDEGDVNITIHDMRACLLVTRPNFSSFAL